MTGSAKSLLVAGCGYVGLALVREARRRGWTAWGLRRRTDFAPQLSAVGAELLALDMAKPLPPLPPARFVIAAQAPQPGDDDRVTYVDATRNLLDALAGHPPERMVWISSTGVYGDYEGRWVDEDTPPNPATARARILLEAEAMVLRAPFESVILRSGGIYGPGRDPVRRLKEGERRFVSGDEGYVNHVHVEDLVGMAFWVLEHGPGGEIYLGVDDEPLLRPDFYALVAQRARLPWPPAEDARPPVRFVGNRRCTNRKIKALGYRLRYPDVRRGLDGLEREPSAP